jgi:hypothetical protein
MRLLFSIPTAECQAAISQMRARLAAREKEMSQHYNFNFEQGVPYAAPLISNTRHHERYVWTAFEYVPTAPQSLSPEPAAVPVSNQETAVSPLFETRFGEADSALSSTTLSTAQEEDPVPRPTRPASAATQPLEPVFPTLATQPQERRKVRRRRGQFRIRRQIKKVKPQHKSGP